MDQSQFEGLDSRQGRDLRRERQFPEGSSIINKTVDIIIIIVSLDELKQIIKVLDVTNLGPVDLYCPNCRQ